VIPEQVLQPAFISQKKKITAHAAVKYAPRQTLISMISSYSQQQFET
jgi:hypothetical protein